MTYSTLDAVQLCAKALSDKKSTDIKILDIHEKSSITDYFVIATATSEPHLRALRREIDEVLHDVHIRPLGIDYHPASGWLVVDAFHFMVHVFLEDQRKNYALEALWNDGEVVPLVEDIDKKSE